MNHRGIIYTCLLNIFLLTPNDECLRINLFNYVQTLHIKLNTDRYNLFMQYHDKLLSVQRMLDWNLYNIILNSLNYQIFEAILAIFVCSIDIGYGEKTENGKGFTCGNGN